MPTFKGTYEEWRIIICALSHLGCSMVLHKELISDEWNDITTDDVQKLFTEIQYEMGDK